MKMQWEYRNTVKRCSNVPDTIVSDHKPHFVFGVLPIAHRSTKMCHEAHPSLLGLQRWGPTMLPKNTPRTGCIFAHTTNPQPKPFQPASSPPMQRNTPQCGVTKQCVAKECGAKMWRHRTMWRHQTMWRQTMWRQNVASQENVASPSNVAPNNAAPKCGATGKCGVTKQCGAKQCSANMWRHRKMRRHQTMWRQTMWRHMSSKCVFIMCLQRQVEKCVLFCQHRVNLYKYMWHVTMCEIVQRWLVNDYC